MGRFILVFLFAIAFWLTISWVTGSVILSGVTAVTNQCNTRMKIESVVAGDWFCPKK